MRMDLATKKAALTRHAEFTRPHRLCGEYLGLSGDDAESLTTLLQSRPGPAPNHRLYCRHLDSSAVRALSMDPAIIDVVRHFIGNNVMLWLSTFWIKAAEDPDTPWHQDVWFWDGTIPTVTVWVALTEARKNTGCLRFLPGSCNRIWPHAAPLGAAGLGYVSSVPVNDDKEVCVELEAGEFVAFNERVLHRSLSPRSKTPRIAFVARYSSPRHRLPHGKLPLFPGHVSLIVHGQDRYRVNPTQGVDWFWTDSCQNTNGAIG